MRLEVDGAPCVAYPRLTGPVALERRRARERAGAGARARLGRLRRAARQPHAGPRPRRRSGAHVMKLPYTPLQAAWPTPRRRAARRRARRDAGGLLLAAQPARAGVRGARRRPSRRVRPARRRRAAGLALRHGARAEGTGLLEVAVAAGAVLRRRRRVRRRPSALAWSRAQGFDAVVCAIGPGVVGTASRARSRRVGGRRGGQRRVGARRLARRRRPRVRGRRARAPPRRLAPHADRAGALPRARCGSRGRRVCDAPDWLAGVTRSTSTTGARRARGLPLDAHGRGAGRRPVVLRGGVRGRPRSPARSCVPDGGAAPRAGRRPRHLAARSTATRDCSRSRRRGVRRRRVGSSTRRRCTARRSGRSAPRSTGDASEALVATKIWTADEAEARRQLDDQLGVVRRPDRRRAGAQPRRVERAPAVARAGARRRARRAARRHALRVESPSPSWRARFARGASTRCSCPTTRSTARASASCSRSPPSSASP